MNNDNTIICPVCGRIHTTINKNNKLRENIHFRCKTKNWHTYIFWVAGCGYYYNNAKYELIPC